MYININPLNNDEFNKIIKFKNIRKKINLLLNKMK